MAVLRKSKQAPNNWHLGFRVSSWSDFTWKGTGLGRLETIKRIGMQWHCSREAHQSHCSIQDPGRAQARRVSVNNEVVTNTKSPVNTRFISGKTAASPHCSLP